MAQIADVNNNAIMAAAQPWIDAKKKSEASAYFLCLFLGFLGVHRFYLGKPLTGLAMLFTFGGFGVWWFIDIFRTIGMTKRYNAEVARKAYSRYL